MGKIAQSPTFLTAAVERGSISTLVKASGTVEAVVSVDVSSQLSGRIAEVFVNFNDSVTAGKPIAQIDQEIFAARVNEARAALRVARATAQVQKAALERSTVAVANAQTAEKLAEDQSAANKASKTKRKGSSCESSHCHAPASGTERDLSQARALRDAGGADLRASLEQIQMKAEAIAIAEAEKHMAEANLENADAVVEQRQAAVDQAEVDLDRTVLRAPIDGIIIKRDVIQDKRRCQSRSQDIVQDRERSPRDGGPWQDRRGRCRAIESGPVPAHVQPWTPIRIAPSADRFYRSASLPKSCKNVVHLYDQSFPHQIRTSCLLPGMTAPASDCGE